jgi:hypothetical protein
MRQPSIIPRLVLAIAFGLTVWFSTYVLHGAISG